MKFYNKQLFHIYNQGNNRQQVFFSDENYEFFLWKMRAYLQPFGKIVTYCLMPNHFHWQFYVENVNIPRKQWWVWLDKVEFARRKKKYGKNAQPVDRQKNRIAHEDSLIDLNESIGMLLKTYARAINKQKDWTGSLFRKECKAKDGWIDEFNSLIQSNKESNFPFSIKNNYAFQCHCYIHDNAKSADLVVENKDWLFSSYLDYQGVRNGTLCDVKFGKKFMNIE